MFPKPKSLSACSPPPQPPPPPPQNDAFAASASLYHCTQPERAVQSLFTQHLLRRNFIYRAHNYADKVLRQRKVCKNIHFCHILSNFPRKISRTFYLDHFVAPQIGPFIQLYGIILREQFEKPLKQYSRGWRILLDVSETEQKQYQKFKIPTLPLPPWRHVFH